MGGELLERSSRISEGRGAGTQVERLPLNRSGAVCNNRREARLMCTQAQIVD